MYTILRPAKNLERFIECYWVLRVDAQPQLEIGESIFVDGSADLIFNFGSPYRREEIGEVSTERMIPYSNLDATRLQAIRIAQRGTIHLLGLRFKTGGLAAFLPIPAMELTNQVIEVDLVYGSSAKELENQLYDARDDPLQQAHLLDQFLLNRLAPKDQAELPYQVIRYITANAGQVEINKLSKIFGYSPRHLGRIYQQHIGISPKFHARVARFQQALGMLLNSPSLDMSQISAACGYYDQAHLNKEFVGFAGQSPGQYRAQLLLKAGDAIPPNLVRFLQDNE